LKGLSPEWGAQNQLEISEPLPLRETYQLIHFHPNPSCWKVPLIKLNSKVLATVSPYLHIVDQLKGGGEGPLYCISTTVVHKVNALDAT
jgi:hypothetical protein